MKLLRYGPAGQEKPAFVDAQGQIRSLAGHDTVLSPGSGKAAERHALHGGRGRLLRRHPSPGRGRPKDKH